MEGWIEKGKNFYFFGLFEGETGQKAPWFLRPSITFPLAFLIVGAAFYVSFMSGAITERGAQITDELDEIILSSTSDVGKRNNVGNSLDGTMRILEVAFVRYPQRKRRPYHYRAHIKVGDMEFHNVLVGRWIGRFRP